MCPCRVFSCTCTDQNQQYIMCIAYIVVERVSGWLLFIVLLVSNTPCQVRVVFRVGDVSVRVL